MRFAGGMPTVADGSVGRAKGDLKALPLLRSLVIGPAARQPVVAMAIRLGIIDQEMAECLTDRFTAPPAAQPALIAITPAPKQPQGHHPAWTVRQIAALGEETILEQELNAALARTKLRSAPSRRHHIPDATAYNDVWQSGTRPEAWLTASVVPVRKPGRASVAIASYSTISLTYAACNLIETIAMERPSWIAGAMEFLPVQQTGFRRHRCNADSTADVVFTLEEARSKAERYPTECSLYADDVALWNRGSRRHLTAIKRSLQRSLYVVASFFKAIGLIVWPTKTEALLFHPRAAAQRAIQRLVLTDRPISQSKALTYLERRIDPSLTWIPAAKLATFKANSVQIAVGKIDSRRSAAAACVIPKTGTTIRCRFLIHSSSTAVELADLHLAPDYLAATTPQLPVAIFSDSRSALQELLQQDRAGITVALLYTKLTAIGASGIIREFLRFEPGKDDVVLMTYPTSGTHWMMQIMQLIVYRGSSATMHSEFCERSPFLEDYGERILEVTTNSHPRILTTHFRPGLLKINQSSKYVYVARNPWDLCASMYDQCRQTPLYPLRATFQELLPLFLQGYVSYGS
ncbi:hypothetical protein HPB52_013494 [Rhipicephalus sanguineus]|uniref:Sulfotransferase domain-containing protein n=1 Tax=Rhipicephalus sanguineus TaxID=34632 RepID=A0A9D4SUG4_RHISA|nr:hypothetical protein HPB52_013494 [Rhipicephalus sanguineus]